MCKLYIIIFIITFPISYKIRTVEGTCEVANSLGVSPTIKLSTGSVEGLSCVSVLGLPYFSFRGIPYAAPPLHDLRFKAPQPPLSWEGVLNATAEAPACPQPKRNISFPMTYSEDCLFVNVFTPYLKHPSGKRMPVIVFFCGGNFFKGSGSSYKFGPDFLIEKEVILVTFNYRLGVFGYLNLNISEAQGNAAMKDSVAVLKWVQREISNFGGDPNLVTIFGDSSGGSAVALLYVSPMAKGLFSRAVSHSGSIIGYHYSTYDIGLQLAQALNCDSPTPEGIVACLREVDANELAEKQMMFDGVHGFENPFLPTLEDYHGEEVFLPEAPQILISQASAVPYLMGVTNAEGLMYIKDPAEHPDQFSNISILIMKNLPDSFLETANLPVLQEAVSRVQDFYFGNSHSLLDTIYGFVNYMSDQKIRYDLLKAVNMVSVRAPVYLFYFTFEGEFQARDHDFNRLNYSLSGVSHGEELGYFFYRNYTLPAHNNLSAYPRDMNMVDKLTTMWTNFAAYGDPTPFQPKESNSTWLPVEGELTQYLLIGDVIYRIRKPLLEDRVAFWDSLYSFVLTSLKKSLLVTNLTTSGTCFLLVCVVIISFVFVKNYRKYKDYVTF